MRYTTAGEECLVRAEEAGAPKGFIADRSREAHCWAGAFARGVALEHWH